MKIAVRILKRLESNEVNIREGEKIVKETVKEVSCVVEWIRCYLDIILLGYR